MVYLLKNKDKAVLQFEVETLEVLSPVSNTKESIQAIKDICVLDSGLLPRGFKDDISNTQLATWIKDRKIPKNRRFVENVIATYNSDNKELLMDYIDVSLGLSLNDTFWIIPSNKDYQWKDYNLYDNAFSEALQRASFGEELLKINGLTTSPEYTTNGVLKKCWHREGQNIYLYKSSSQEYANGGKEAYSEYYMAQIAEMMEFNYVPYDLKIFHNELVSSCLIFTNADEGYVPIFQVFEDEKWKNLQGIELINYIAEYYSIESLQDMLVFDALIMNKDRHLGNFGMIIDNNTNRILKPAPIFDNGCSMLNYLTLNELQKISDLQVKTTSYFSFTFDEQLRLFVQPRHIPNLKKLQSFYFKRHSKYNLDEEWLQPLEKYIQQRATKALSFIESHSLSFSLLKSQAQENSRNQESRNTDSMIPVIQSKEELLLEMNKENKERELKEEEDNYNNVRRM